MASLRVSLLGATGETGRSILDGLLEQGNFTVEALVRPSSAEKPSVKKLAERGVIIRFADLSGPSEALVSALSGVDVLISAISAGSQLEQKALASAAREAGVKRFLPCGFTTIAPPGDVMILRDDKEEIYAHVKEIGLPYTVVDVGYWYQISYPRLPSGRVDYAMPLPNSDIHGDGEAPNILIDKRDIGRFVARIITDDRTLDRYVYACGAVLTENQIFAMMEELSGEKIERNQVSNEQIEAELATAKRRMADRPADPRSRLGMYKAQYAHSKYVRQDNQPKVAEQLGYLDARELYPDVKPVSFREFLAELLDGKIEKPYSGIDLSSTSNTAVVDSHLVPGAGRRNYTGFITKTILYSATLILFIVAFALTIAAIALPRWVTYHGETPKGERYHYSYGLYERCSSVTNTCDPFPQYEDCKGAENGYFCSMWRSIGFLMSFAVVLDGMTLITYLIILGGGKQKRETGWKLLTLFLLMVGLVQCAAMGLVSYLYDHDDHFHAGWKLDDSWIMCTVSFCLSMIAAIIIWWTASILPSEGGYELIVDNS